MRWFLPDARLCSDEELAQLLRDAGFDAVEVHLGMTTPFGSTVLI